MMWTLSPRSLASFTTVSRVATAVALKPVSVAVGRRGWRRAHDAATRTQSKPTVTALSIGRVRSASV